MAERVFFSSEGGLPDGYLYGFAYAGVDVVIGDAAYAEFIAKTGRRVAPGDDGGFIVVNRQGRRHTVGTDFGGYAKIYYHHDPASGRWALSNSLPELAEHLKRRGKPVAIDPLAVAGLVFDGSLGEQPPFHRTLVEGVRLLPKNKALVIEDSAFGKSFAVTDIGPPAAFRDGGGRYEDRLKAYLDIWTGRFCTMLGSDLHLICDLTGGLDSRVCFALLLRAARLAGSDLPRRMLFFSRTTVGKDFGIARSVAETHGIKINDPALREFYWYNSDESYQAWRSRYLYGSYPIRFPGFARSGNQLWICGNGGESHRWPRWRSISKGIATMDQVIALRRPLFANEADYRAVREEMLKDSRMLGADPTQPRNGVVRHYRNFRERFHHGRRAETVNSVAPLSDSRLSACSSLIDVPEIRSMRVHADIIHNCEASLNDLPLAGFGYANYAGLRPERLTSLDPSDAAVDLGGSVYRGSPVPIPGQFEFREVLELLAEEFAAAVPAAQELGFVPPEAIGAARKMIAEARLNGRFGYPPDTKPITLTVLAGRLAACL